VTTCLPTARCDAVRSACPPRAPGLRSHAGCNRGVLASGLGPWISPNDGARRSLRARKTANPIFASRGVEQSPSIHLKTSGNISERRRMKVGLSHSQWLWPLPSHRRGRRDVRAFVLERSTRSCHSGSGRGWGPRKGFGGSRSKSSIPRPYGQPISRVELHPFRFRRELRSGSRNRGRANLLRPNGRGYRRALGSECLQRGFYSLGSRAPSAIDNAIAVCLATLCGDGGGGTCRTAGSR
jgi:hypothetical protein